MGSRDYPQGSPRLYGHRMRPYTKDLRNPASWLGMMLERGDDRRFNEETLAYQQLGTDRLRAIGTEEANKLADVWEVNASGVMQAVGGPFGMMRVEETFRANKQKKSEQQQQGEMLQRRVDVSRGYFDSLEEGQEPRSMDLLEAGIRAGIPAELMQGVTSLVEAYEAPVPAKDRTVVEDGIQYWAEGPNAKKRVLDTPLGDDLPVPKVPADKQFASEGEVRREYNKLSEPYVSRRGSVAQIEALGELALKSPMAQRGLIFSIMKLFDPTSVVRESEQLTVENARGVPASIRNYRNKVWAGEVLTDEQVSDIMRTAKMSLLGATKVQKEIEAQYRNIATESELSVESAVPDYLGEYRSYKPAPTDTDVANFQEKIGTSDPVALRKAMEEAGYSFGQGEYGAGAMD